MLGTNESEDWKILLECTINHVSSLPNLHYKHVLPWADTKQAHCRHMTLKELNKLFPVGHFKLSAVSVR